MKLISPFVDRQDEWDVISPFVGKSMLELGNKKNGDITYKSFFQRLGLAHTSVDWNGEDGALKLDLREPLPLGKFDMVTNIGTSEHVDNQVGVWRNMIEALNLGAVLISITPILRDWPGHGLFYPTLDFYGELATRNALKIDKMYVGKNADNRRLIYFRARRYANVPFIMPDPCFFDTHREVMW